MTPRLLSMTDNGSIKIMAENGNQEFLRETRQILTTMYHLFKFETHPQNIVLLYPIEWALPKNMKQFFPNKPYFHFYSYFDAKQC